MTIHPKPENLLRGATGDWEIIVGMEIHAQVVALQAVLRRKGSPDSCRRRIDERDMRVWLARRIAWR